jgi:hypothetical protein
MLHIEDTEINMWESTVNTSAKCTIKNDVFSCLRSEEMLYNSDVYNYEDIKVVACNEPRFGEYYLNIAAYSEDMQVAWPLVTVPRKLDTRIRRLARDSFLIWTNSNKPELSNYMKQATFCRTQDNEKVNNITIDYNVLHAMHVFGNNFVLLECVQTLGGYGTEPKDITTLTLYNRYGKAIKIIYEYYAGFEDSFKFNFNPEKMSLTVEVTNKKGKTRSEAVNLTALCDAAEAELQAEMGDQLAPITSPEPAIPESQDALQEVIIETEAPVNPETPTIPETPEAPANPETPEAPANPEN